MEKSSCRSFIIGLMICLWCSGCAAFAGGKLQELDKVPAAPKASPKANLVITWKTFINGISKPENEQVAVAFGMKYALEAFEETGYFSEVSPTVDNPDVQIKVRVQEKGEGSMVMAIITGLTLYLIPSSATEHYVMDAEVTNLKTGQTRSYHLEDSATLYQQILLIFLMPFNWPDSVVEDVLENMFTHLAVNIQKDGLLATAQIGSNRLAFHP